MCNCLNNTGQNANELVRRYPYFYYMNQIQHRNEQTNGLNPFQNQKQYSGTTFISEINSIIGSAQALSFGNPLLRVAMSSPNINNLLSNTGVGFGLNASRVLLYSGRDGRTFVLDVANGNNNVHTLVLIQDNAPFYWAKTEAIYADGNPSLKASLSSASGNDNIEIIIKTTTYAYLRSNIQNPPPPPPVAPCNQQGLSFADCFKCSWNDLGSDALGIIYEALFPIECIVACMLACAFITPGGPSNPNIQSL